MSAKAIPLKVSIIHYTCPEAEKGGVETVIKYHAPHLTRRGFDVTVIYGRGGGLEGVREIHVDELDPKNPLISEIQEKILGKVMDEETRAKFDEAKGVLKEKIRTAIKGMDIVIVHNIPTMPFNFPATVAINELTKEVDTNFIYWIHDSIALRREWSSYMKRWPFTEILRRQPNVTYVTITEFRAKQLSRLWNRNHEPREIKVIPNGIDIDEYIKLDEVTMKLNDRLNLKWEDYIILMPIRVVPRKNIELGIRIVYELKRLIHRPSVKLIITGPPDKKYLKRLKRIIKKLKMEDDILFIHDLISFERLHKDGEIVKWGIADAYALADMVLLTSKEEGFGLPLLEAGAARKPLFVTRIRPFEEILKEGVEAQMFGLNEDPSVIAFKIYRYLLSDIVQHNFNNIIRKYRWDVIVKNEIIPLLKEITSSSKQKGS